MPDLARVAEDYADNVGFISLLDDYNDNHEGARDIVEAAGMPESFIMIDARTEGLEDLQYAVTSGYVPTTLIFDGQKQFWTDRIVGSEENLFGDLLARLLTGDE